MKTVNDFLNTLSEDGAAVNVVGDGTGSIKTTPTPLSAVVKRKVPLEDAEAPSTAVANPEPGITKVDSSEDKKRMFRNKQASQSDQLTQSY